MIFFIKILKMQSSNLLPKINLSEKFPGNSLNNLLKVFPQLNNLVHSQNDSNNSSSHGPIFVDKYVFYKLILEKIKNYFELKETFTISNSISIILNDLKNISENLPQKLPKKSNLKKKVQFPLINQINSHISKENKPQIIRNKTLRNFSTKSNGGKIINGPKHTNLNLNSSFNTDESNCGKINYVYLNLDKIENPKLKNVRFADDAGIKTKRSKTIVKSVSKKSNLKKYNYNLKNELNKTINFKEIEPNNLPNIKIKKRLKLRTKTEYLKRNKSNGIKVQENSVNIEKYGSKEKISSNKLINILYDENINLNDFYNIDDKDFNIFEFAEEVGKDNTLPLISKYIFNYFNFGDIINISKYGYKDNSYHTNLHAADITQTSFIYFKVGLINEIIKLDKTSICSLFLSCICHDYKHPGFNNNFLIETNNSIAINYNDISVLENMHISETFKLIFSDENYNIFQNFEKTKYKKIRKQMISCVISTDMSYHNKSLNFMKSYLQENNKNNEFIEKNEQEYMNLVIHAADISNPTKKFDVYYKWAELVVDEFYQQGDKEKELGLQCSCDRNKISLYKSQLGFIDFIEIPFFSQFVQVFPKLEYLCKNLNNNRERIKLLEDEENKNKEINEKNMN